MKQYPSIRREISRGPFYIFQKVDGSSIRAEWRRKRGFYKFGTRRRMLGPDDPMLGEAIPLFNDKYADKLESIFLAQRWLQAIAFFEFWGEHSFAGRHEDEPHDVTLFDVSYERKGILNPKIFLKLFGDLSPSLYIKHGNVNQEVVQAVRDGTFPGMTFEGVVCKCSMTVIGPGLPLMFKIKSDAWISKLKGFCKGNEQLFKELL